MSEQTHRRVVVFCGVSIDGFSSERAGPAHDTWLHENALPPQSGASFESVSARRDDGDYGPHQR